MPGKLRGLRNPHAQLNDLVCGQRQCLVPDRREQDLSLQPQRRAVLALRWDTVLGRETEH